LNGKQSVIDKLKIAQKMVEQREKKLKKVIDGT